MHREILGRRLMRPLFCDLPIGRILFLPSFPRTREPSVFALRSIFCLHCSLASSPKIIFLVRDSVQVKQVTFFALGRELLSLAHCAASGANGEAGPKGERRRRESRK